MDMERGRRAFHRVPYVATEKTGRMNAVGDWQYSHLAERSPGLQATDGRDARMLRYYSLNEPDYALTTGLNADGQYATIIFHPSHVGCGRYSISAQPR